MQPYEFFPVVSLRPRYDAPEGASPQLLLAPALTLLQAHDRERGADDVD